MSPSRANRTPPAPDGRRRRIALRPHDAIEEHAAPGVARTDHRDGTTTLQIAHRHLGYVNAFMRRRCAPDLLALRVFPDAKEITESEGLRRAAIDGCGCDPRDPGIAAVVVGDGATPRTGALLAFTTRWQVVSIDPRADAASVEHVRRLTTRNTRIERAEPWPAPGSHTWVVLAPHSHARLDDALAWARANAPPGAALHAAACPCCVVQRIAERPCEERYRDLGIWSDRGSLQIWRHLEHTEQPPRTTHR